MVKAASRSAGRRRGGGGARPVVPPSRAGRRASRPVPRPSALPVWVPESLQGWLTALGNQSTIGVVLLDDSRIVFVNDAMTRLTGVPAERLVGLDLRDGGAFPDREQFAAVQEWLRRRDAGPEEVLPPFEFHVRAPDGEERWMLASGAWVGVGERRLRLAIVVDLTERRRIEEELRKSERQYRDLVETSIDGVLILQDGIVRYANPVACEALGSSRADIVGRSFLEFVAPEELPNVLELHRRRMAGEVVPPRFESAVCRTDGTKLEIEASACRIVHEGRPAVLLLTRDIGPRKRLEEEAARARSLEALGTLASGVAHDVNNVLTAILGNLSLVRMEVCGGGGDGGLLAEPLAEIERACRRARSLTDRLLTYGGRGAPVDRAASVADVVQEAVAAALRGATVRAELTIADDVRPVQAQADELREVLESVVAAARDQSPEGGVVQVAAENVVVDAGKGRRAGGRREVRLSVTDRGRGIRPELLARVFEPYGARGIGEDGLRLAAAHAIVRRRAGRMEVESQPGRGTTFRVYLPAAPARARRSARASASGGGRVLLMDDDRSLREPTASLLRRSGFEVDTAADGEEAVRLFRRGREAGRGHDVVIVDLTVDGGMGGEECRRRLADIDPAAKVVISSGYSNDPILADWKKHGFAAALAKPFVVQELVETIGRLLR